MDDGGLMAAFDRAVDEITGTPGSAVLCCVEGSRLRE